MSSADPPVVAAAAPPVLSPPPPASPNDGRAAPTAALTASALKTLPAATPRPRSDSVATAVDSDVSLNPLPVAAPDPRRGPATAAPAPTWDAFVRQGSRLKALLGDTVAHLQAQQQQQTATGKRRRRAADENAKNRSRPEEEGDDDDDASGGNDAPPRRRARMEAKDSVLELLQEKTTEIMRLQRILKEAQADGAALQVTNAALREEAAAAQGRLDRTTEALRRSTDTAAQARADAEAAEATAASLAQTLQSLQAVVDETKNATYLLHQEQQQLAEASTSVEARLLEKETELARATAALRTLSQARATFDMEAAKWAHEKTELELRAERSQRNLEELRKAVLERDAVEAARKQRAHKVEEDLRHTQALLREATSGQEQAAQAQATMQLAISELQRTNQQLHTQVTSQQESSQKELARLNEALTKVEKESQSLRIQNEAFEEDMERLRLDKIAIEKQNCQLKSQIVGLEMQLKEASCGVVAAKSDVAATPKPTGPQDRSSTSRKSLPFTLPPLGSSGPHSADKSVDLSNDAACSICFKAPFGLMKRCQCGKADCSKRAHATCANRLHSGTSVSHPGTPGPPLPLVLCLVGGGAAANMESVAPLDGAKSDQVPEDGDSNKSI